MSSPSYTEVSGWFMSKITKIDKVMPMDTETKLEIGAPLGSVL